VSGPSTAPGPFAQALEIAGKDLRLELRAGEALLVTAPFGAVALLLVPLAVGTDVPMLRSVGSGMYWVIVLLFGVLVTLRQSAVDTPPQAALLRLAGIHPAVAAAGRAAGRGAGTPGVLSEVVRVTVCCPSATGSLRGSEGE